jgi:hypothetical protein
MLRRLPFLSKFKQLRIHKYPNIPISADQYFSQFKLDKSHYYGRCNAGTGGGHFRVF